MKRLTQEQLVARAMTEKQLQDGIVECATALGWTVFHVRDSRRQMVVGLPDLLLLRPPRAEWWELKREPGAGRHTEVTHAQGDTMLLLEACGIKTRVMRPRHWRAGLVENLLM